MLRNFHACQCPFTHKKWERCISLDRSGASNNQCHLYSLIGAQILKGYSDPTVETLLEKTQENRFLHLAFLLSTSFLTDRKLLCRAVATADDGKESARSGSKLDAFMKDHTLIRQARISLNAVFEACMKERFAAEKEASPLHREMYQLALENLHVPQERGGGSLYTLPKIAGVVYLVHKRIPFVIKSLVFEQEGKGVLSYQSGNVKEDEPVLVFEALTSSRFSIPEFRAIAGRCPSYFERKVSKRDRHSEHETCAFCQQTSIDTSERKPGFEKATQEIRETLYALGADFVQEAQPQFVKHFQDKKNYPCLTDLFNRAAASIDELGLSMNRPRGFSILHVYLDSGKLALSSKMRIQSSPESFLKERGIL